MLSINRYTRHYTLTVRSKDSPAAKSLLTMITSIQNA
jgi:hypothetical protein